MYFITRINGETNAVAKTYTAKIYSKFAYNIVENASVWAEVNYCQNS